MTATALTTTTQQAQASVEESLRGSAPVLQHASREDLVMLIGSIQEAMNTLAAARQLALAHVAAIEDTRDLSGDWTEQHRGLGHTTIGAPGDVAGVMGLSETATETGSRMRSTRSPSPQSFTTPSQPVN